MMPNLKCPQNSSNSIADKQKHRGLSNKDLLERIGRKDFACTQVLNLVRGQPALLGLQLKAVLAVDTAVGEET